MFGRLRSVVGRRGERLFVWLFVLAVLAAVGFVLTAGLPGLDGEASARSAGGQVDVTRSDGNYVLQPSSGESDIGLVFYPGGNVAPESYVSPLSSLAREANVTVVVVKMPGDLAVLDQGAANRVLDRRSEVETWYVGGHSLGGAISCRYARNNPQRVEGVVLFAAYCDRSIADTELEVLSVTGSADTVLNETAYERNKGNLPADATLVTVPGMNHSQFGNYTDQPDDGPSNIAYAEAHARLSNVTVPWFRIARTEHAS